MRMSPIEKYAVADAVGGSLLYFFGCVMIFT